MGTKVKGLLKGLKHLSITNLFDSKEEEPEIQIGFPTDVKHVAHIGMDDANTTKPSWMGDLKSAPELPPQSAPASEATSKSSGGEKSKGKKRDKDKKKDKDKEGSSRRGRKSRDSNNLNESEDSSTSSKHSKKKKTKGSSSNDGEGSTSKTSKKSHKRDKSLPDESVG